MDTIDIRTAIRQGLIRLRSDYDEHPQFLKNSLLKELYDSAQVALELLSWSSPYSLATQLDKLIQEKLYARERALRTDSPENDVSISSSEVGCDN